MISLRTKFLILAFCVGFVSLIYQVYSYEVIFFYFTKSSLAVSIATSSFLAGIGFSSIIVSRYINKNNARFFIGTAQILVATYALLFMGHYDLIPKFIDLFQKNEEAKFVNYFLLWFYFFIPALFVGCNFPIINGLYLESIEKSIRDTGQLYSTETFGAVIGSILTGVFFIPYFGIANTLYIAIFINLVLAYVFFVKKYIKNIILFFIIIFGFSVAPLDKSLIKYMPRFGNVLFQKNSPFGVVTVGEIKQNKNLFINYRVMCSSHDNQDTSHIVMAHESIKHIKEKSNVLHIGLGCGMTAAVLANSKKIHSLDIVEINPVVVEAAKEQFHESNNQLLSNPKVQLYIENGSEFLRKTKKKYDLVLIDIEEVAVIYSSPMYTDEFFKIIKNLLTPEGFFSLWSVSNSAEFNKILLNTLQNNFHHTYAQVFLTESIVLYAKKDKSFSIPKAKMQTDTNFTEIKNNEINTLDNKALLKYYNSNKSFLLPDGYKEAFVE